MPADGDSILCQVTSKPYGDDHAVMLDDAHLAAGSLRVVSFARPGKLFTANQALIATTVATLTPDALTRVVEAVVSLLRVSVNRGRQRLFCRCGVGRHWLGWRTLCE